jgi:hypothetical protein
MRTDLHGFIEETDLLAAFVIRAIRVIRVKQISMLPAVYR